MTQNTSPPRDPLPERPGTDGDGRPRRTILVAEDDADIRLMLKTLLKLKGFCVRLAEDGQKAVEMARAERPDLILVDLQLPRLNGFAVVRCVRQTDELRTVPVVILTGHDPLKHRKLALAAGCNAYLQKPLDLQQFDELILKLLPPIESQKT